MVTMVVGGVNKTTGEVTLAQSDHLGTKLTGDWIATGLGHHYLGAIFSTVWKPGMTEQEAQQMLELGMKVMFQRDKKAIDKMQVATITSAGVTIGDAYRFDAYPDWRFHHEQTNENYRPSRVPPTKLQVNQ